jgi:tetratricopeptide (TPR) repeat protein
MVLRSGGDGFRYPVDGCVVRNDAMEVDMRFRYGRVVGRHRTIEGDHFFEWRPGRDRGPGRRDLTWEFEEPDQYPSVVASQKPGMMVSKSEKAFHAAVASGDADSMLDAGRENPKYATVSKTIAGLLLLESDVGRAIALLDEVIDSGSDIGKDHFVRKYLPEAGLTVVIASGVVVRLPLQTTSLILLLAELHQARDEDDKALALLDRAESTTHVRLSQAELLYDAGQWDRVLELTQGVINDDDVTALMLAYRGRALAEVGRDEEGVAVLARALEYPNRAESIKAIALVGRGMIHQAHGDNILAENDFTQALMEVPHDEEARQHIQELIHGRGAD